MYERLLAAYVWQAMMRGALGARLARDERGEGVISAAIAVLVMAFLGVLMWQLFGDTLRHANSNVNDHLDQMK
jgi:Tfp pilus assembly protein PilX